MKEKSGFPVQLKRRIIGTLLAGMNAHKDEETMMRNGCLALCQFHIPQDVVSFTLKTRRVFVRDPTWVMSKIRFDFFVSYADVEL